MIFTSFFKALAQLPDPRFQSVLWRGIGITIALLIGCYAGLLGLIDAFRVKERGVYGPNGLSFIRLVPVTLSQTKEPLHQTAKTLEPVGIAVCVEEESSPVD